MGCFCNNRNFTRNNTLRHFQIASKVIKFSNNTSNIFYSKISIFLSDVHKSSAAKTGNGREE